jgi:hypothetical protein
MAPESQLAFVVVATVALLALALAAFNAVRIEALRRREKPPPPCDRLHVSNMDAHGLSVVVQGEAPTPKSPQYLTVEDMPSMRGPVPGYVDLDPPTKKSPS